ncbi:CDP-glycerol glycerophosphotransferase family protein [Sphingorhabdus sp. YGSMI21]|uniref:CDP-glycerol glycerophosphotransferase family protein n=1 Tax=Sphingorhabdus sp. YGSMI21 TaxID=2077182 RepID=UPI000C1E6D4D|nr:CDP-glycerol glycerophosphotransferase family protein [Sphingorhabdus sp. YGSMI21]ATW02410.1 hypothetical protein CHN51_01870 [Sphingorhabdus sp. YGSMI21]
MSSESSPDPRRIGFLFNHDELHQVAHIAPIIPALQRQATSARVEIITSSDRQADAVRQFLDPALPTPAFWSIRPNRWSRLAENMLGRMVPLNRLSSLKRSTELFRHFDALVVPETTTTFLKKIDPSARPKLIFFPHGAGDRSIGFSPEISLFDHVLLPGEKTRDRMLAAGVIRPDNHRIVGYPKFQAYADRPPVKLFDNDKPVVLYNPHFDPLLSSWFRFGAQILDHFANQTDYNLIFAPHVMLFQRKLLASVEHRMLKFRQHIDPRYAALDHIHVDIGSSRSVDMSYTNAADIYIGDVSSQIYEFIRTPRPAIFFNSHDADWQGNANYDHWNFGPVLDDVADLGPALKAVSPLPDIFREAQTRAFDYSFDRDDSKAPSQRAAQAIAEFLALS